MLFLRRSVGDTILVFDERTELTVEVTGIDLETETVSLSLAGEATELQLHESISVLQGDGAIRAHTIQEYVDGTSYVSLGVSVPDAMRILRGELVRGTTRDERSRMSR